ncbi:hypothetical protein RUM43_006938 [Polyplax serrata]|uniref:Uncharacterized protein n=1 Tax=Polyplax serrata TaxID=468196 RepID=A0AAN8SA33_POLSC
MRLILNRVSTVEGKGVNQTRRKGNNKNSDDENDDDEDDRHDEVFNKFKNRFIAEIADSNLKDEPEFPVPCSAREEGAEIGSWSRRKDLAREKQTIRTGVLLEMNTMRFEYFTFTSDL